MIQHLLYPLFAVPTDVLLGVASPRASQSPGKRGPPPKLQRQLERVSRRHHVIYERLRLALVAAEG